MSSKSNSNLLAKFLKAKRIKAGLSQKEVSDKLGYSSAQFISNWERGLSSPPMDTLKQLTDTLNVKPKELIEVILQETKLKLEENLSIPQKKRVKKA